MNQCLSLNKTQLCYQGRRGIGQTQESGMAEADSKSDMAETKDSAIKLFGMTISLKTDEEDSSSIPAKLDITEKEMNELEFDDVKRPVSKVENQHDHMKEEEEEEQQQEEEEEEEEREEKFVKPDKILPCPRCNSFETKFCYFNNYNVNQPRHFCRNCQRYWTAGGTMRNVPIGAGRRRNKLLRIHETPIRSANSETTHLTPIVNFSHREAKEEHHTHTTNHAVPVPVAPFVYQCNRILDTSNDPNRIQTNGIIPFQFVPMPCWVWTLGGGNRNMQQPLVGFDNMGLDKNASSRLGKHSRDDFHEEKQHPMLGFKTPRRTDEPGKNS